MVKFNSNYLKAEEIKDGDSIKFTNPGEWQTSTKYKYPDGNFKKDFVIGIDFKGQEKTFRLNKSNRDILIKAFGNDSEKWIGLSVSLTLETILVSGERKKMIMLNPPQNKTTAPVSNEVPWDEK